MSTTPLLDAAYSPRAWDLLVVERSGVESAGIPTTTSDLNVYSIDSPRAEQVEQSLERGLRLPQSTFIFDLEVLSCGGDHSLTAGGCVSLLAEDYRGYPKGSVVMTVYHMDERGLALYNYVEAIPQHS